MSETPIPTAIRKMTEVTTLVYRADTEGAIRVRPTGNARPFMDGWEIEVITAPCTPRQWFPARELRFCW